MKQVKKLKRLRILAKSAKAAAMRIDTTPTYQEHTWMNVEEKNKTLNPSVEVKGRFGQVAMESERLSESITNYYLMTKNVTIINYKAME